MLEGSKVGIRICCSFAIDNSILTNYNYGDLHSIFKLNLIIADQVSKCQDLWNGQFCIQKTYLPVKELKCQSQRRISNQSRIRVIQSLHQQMIRSTVHRFKI